MMILIAALFIGGFVVGCQSAHTIEFSIYGIIFRKSAIYYPILYKKRKNSGPLG
jgi:hypothetical protein